MKICSKCGTIDAKRWYSGPTCKKCYRKEYDSKHRDYINSKQNEKRKQDPLKSAEYQRNWRANHKDRSKESKHIYVEKNRSVINAKQREYRLRHLEQTRTAVIKWRTKNENYKEKRASRDRHIDNIRYKEDINYKLRKVLRHRLSSALKKNQKVGSAVTDLGCSIAKFKIYLQLKFYRNPRGKHEYMAWDNYGKYGWHIDHIEPLCSFDLTDREQLLKACHYTNLRPLWHSENLSKSAEDKLKSIHKLPENTE